MLNSSAGVIYKMELKRLLTQCLREKDETTIYNLIISKDDKIKQLTRDLQDSNAAFQNLKAEMIDLGIEP